MSRTEFMQRLKTLLSDLEREEREEVIRYYEDYFDDAGADQEQAVITQLESPEAVARTIKLDLQSKDTLEKGEYWENGYHNPVFEEKYELEKANQLQETNSYQEEQNQRQQEREQFNQKKQTTKQPKDYSKTILIVLGCILAAPIILSLLGALLGVVLGLFGLVIGLFFACAGLAVALTIAGIVTFISGIGAWVVSIPTAVLLFGIGLILLSIGLLFTLLTIIMVSKFFPFLIRSISDLGNKVFYRKKVA